MKLYPLFVGVALSLALAGQGCISGPTARTNTPPPAQPKPVVNSPPVQADASGLVLTTLKGETNRIRLRVPTPGNKISRPLLIAGDAHGWYFEGSFPVWILNANGVRIGSGIAKANGDWMTDDWVPFTGEIEYPPQPAGSQGALVLSKDNPSGDPVNDDSVSVPILF